MDLYCPRCGEPWDNDTFHEAASEQNTTYRAIVRDFQRRGCIAIGWQSEPCEPVRNSRTALAEAAYELLGDDTDGAAAMLEDAGYDFGLELG